MKNGSLLDLLRKERAIKEESLKFYIASIALGLNFLHSKNFIYRDLKLENILIDKKGYIKLSDFGISKYLTKRQKCYEIIGTSDYLAPEIIKSVGYNFEIDYWSLGILVLELVNGYLPFFDRNLVKLYVKICKEEPKFNKELNISEDCKDLITNLLNKDPFKRLGSKNGIYDIINHKFFKDFNWKLLMNKSIKAPFNKINVDINLGKYDESNIENLTEEENEILCKFENKFI